MSTTRRPVQVDSGVVFGGGAFGTCLAMLLTRNGAKKVRVWHPFAEEVDKMNKSCMNEKYLPSVQLAPEIEFTADVKTALSTNSPVLAFAIPTQHVRTFLRKNKPMLESAMERSKIVFIACKGIETSTLAFPLRIFEEELGRAVHSKFAVVAGPSFAIEVAESKLTHVSVAARDLGVARYGQEVLSTFDGSFRCFAARDVMACEVASAMKNVLAIASGAAQGLGLGRNARALIITRGLIEIVLLADALTGKSGSLPAILSLAGVGDIVLTCTSSKSRNFSVGVRIGKGERIADIQKSMTAVAEGVATADALEKLAKKAGVKLPLCEAVFSVLQGRTTCKDAMDVLTDPKKTGLSDEPLAHWVASPSKL